LARIFIPICLWFCCSLIHAWPLSQMNSFSDPHQRILASVACSRRTIVATERQGSTSEAASLGTSFRNFHKSSYTSSRSVYFPSQASLANSVPGLVLHVPGYYPVFWRLMGPGRAPMILTSKEKAYGGLRKTYYLWQWTKMEKARKKNEEGSRTPVP